MKKPKSEKSGGGGKKIKTFIVFLGIVFCLSGQAWGLASSVVEIEILAGPTITFDPNLDLTLVNDRIFGGPLNPTSGGYTGEASAISTSRSDPIVYSVDYMDRTLEYLVDGYGSLQATLPYHAQFATQGSWTDASTQVSLFSWFSNSTTGPESWAVYNRSSWVSQALYSGIDDSFPEITSGDASGILDIITEIPAGTAMFSLNYKVHTLAAAGVPEPATMLLLGSGLIGLAWFGRKKFSKRSST